MLALKNVKPVAHESGTIAAGSEQGNTSKHTVWEQTASDSGTCAD